MHRLLLLKGRLPWFSALLLLAGCFVASEEGQRISKIGGDLLVTGHSDGKPRVIFYRLEEAVPRLITSLFAHRKAML